MSSDALQFKDIAADGDTAMRGLGIARVCCQFELQVYRSSFMSIKTSFLKPVSAALAVALLSTSVGFAQATAPAPTAPKAPATAPAPTAPKAPAAPAAAAPAPKAAPAAAPVTAPKAQLVNLNTATAEQLDGLPQIGAARAKAIIEARAKGKFKNWDDFVARNVIPSNAEAAIKDKVSF